MRRAAVPEVGLRQPAATRQPQREPAAGAGGELAVHAGSAVPVASATVAGEVVAAPVVASGSEAGGLARMGLPESAAGADVGQPAATRQPQRGPAAGAGGQRTAGTVRVPTPGLAPAHADRAPARLSDRASRATRGGTGLAAWGVRGGVGNRAPSGHSVQAATRARQVRVLVVGAGVLLILAAVTLWWAIPGQGPGAVLQAWRGQRAAEFIIGQLRLPRLGTAALVGAALGAAGSLSQSVTRNPLASPDVLGITAGASLAAVVALTAWHVSGSALFVAALVGALAAASLVFTLSWGRGAATLVLVGIAVASGCLAVVSMLLTRARVTDVAQVYAWLTGSVNGATWAGLSRLAVLLIPLLAVAGCAARGLGVLELGPDAAAGLGLRVRRWELGGLGLCAVLAAVGVAAAGPITFVALMAGPVARRLTRTGGPAPVTAGVVGACLVVGSDIVAQFLLPVPLPVGIVTAVLGAPYFLWMLRRVAAPARPDERGTV